MRSPDLSASMDDVVVESVGVVAWNTSVCLKESPQLGDLGNASAGHGVIRFVWMRRRIYFSNLSAGG